MLLVTSAAVVRCGHDARVRNVASKTWFTVMGAPVLVEADPVGRVVVACPNVGLNVKPCTRTLAVQTGYSTFVSVDGHALCLQTVVGPTDGVDAQVVLYTVRDPGQQLVEVLA